MTKGESCPDYYNPASCVSNCESQSRNLEECRKELDAELACYRNTPGAAEARCGFWTNEAPCSLEGLNLTVCLSQRSGSPGAR